MKKLRDLLRLSTVRHTAWFLGLFSAISLVTWGGTFFLIWFEMQRAVDARLTLRMEAAITALAAGESLPPPGPGETAELVQTARAEGFATRNVQPGNRETRFLLRTTPNGQIVLSEDVERQDELRDIVEAGMQLSLLATLICTILVGLWLARRGQARLNAINDGLARVARGTLDQPIVLDGNDDLALLASRINRTTERLNYAMTQMRVQSSSIAHDLRTPLARLRGHLETHLMEAVATDAKIAPDVLGVALEHIDRITGTFEALLRLSRIESGAGKEAFQPVDLKALAEEIAATFGPVIEEAGQTLAVEITEPETVQGDQGLLTQLIANLIQNALRYGADAQTITLAVHGHRLILNDEGPGIPTGEREKVLVPLYQTEKTRQNEGFGLGLSLVQAIAHLHGADLTLAEGRDGKGLLVTVVFPAM
ncbi:sensor histidine kinase [Gymnodinialimonas sp.]